MQKAYAGILLHFWGLGQDPDFFQFYRTMEAYKKSLSPKDTTLVLSPDNDFLKYMEKGAGVAAK